MDYIRTHRWFLLILFAGMAGSFSMLLAFPPGADTGPISLYFFFGLFCGGLAGIFGAIKIDAAESTLDKVIIALLSAAGAFFFAFYFVAITAGGA